MRYVLDSNVGLKWVFQETDSDRARRLRDDYINSAIDLIAPDVFPVEVTHAVTRAERANRITPSEGAQYITAMLALLPAIYSSLTLIPRAYELSSRYRVGVYDCLYVALAEREQCELITADERLVSSIGAKIPMIALSSI